MVKYETTTVDLEAGVEGVYQTTVAPVPVKSSNSWIWKTVVVIAFLGLCATAAVFFAWHMTVSLKLQCGTRHYSSTLQCDLIWNESLISNICHFFHRNQSKEIFHSFLRKQSKKIFHSFQGNKSAHHQVNNIPNIPSLLALFKAKSAFINNYFTRWQFCMNLYYVNLTVFSHNHTFFVSMKAHP